MRTRSGHTAVPSRSRGRQTSSRLETACTGLVHVVATLLGELQLACDCQTRDIGGTTALIGALQHCLAQTTR